MKFLHISDLHFGKTIHGVSMLENGDQPCWVARFLELAQEVAPDAVVIAGDVYDRSSPSAEAVALLGQLVEGLSELGICVMMVSGNHDSGQRMSFAGGLLAKQNVYIAGTLYEELLHVTLQDEYGPVTFWLMPYVFPALISNVLGEDIPRDYDAAVRSLLAIQPLNPSERNVLIAHQNVTSCGKEGMRGGSESMVGGVGQIDYSAFDAFDYVALGHIHAAYWVGRDTVRYAGSPLCYHFDELRQPEKGPLLVEIGAKGEGVTVTTLNIPPLHPMRELRGTLEELVAVESSRQATGEYWKLVITDQPMTPEISARFQALAESRGSILMERTSEYRRYAEMLAGTTSERTHVILTFARLNCSGCWTIMPKCSGGIIVVLGRCWRHCALLRTYCAPVKRKRCGRSQNGFRRSKQRLRWQKRNWQKWTRKPIKQPSAIGKCLSNPTKK